MVSQKIISPEQRQDFAECLKKYLTANEELSADLFQQCINCYLFQLKLIKTLLKDFKRVEVLESYGTMYMKLRVPKLDKSLGYIFGLIENSKLDGIQQYSVNQTSLEMIFNFFAEGGTGSNDINKN